VRIEISKVNHDAVLPTYKHVGDAGFDLRSLVGKKIQPGHYGVFGTGLSFGIPFGFELQIRQRSGLSKDFPNYLVNSPATIDSGYTGEVTLIIRNNSKRVWRISPGDRIAQGVIAPVIRAEFVEVDTLWATDRGDGGWGCTGVTG